MDSPKDKIGINLIPRDERANSLTDSYVVKLMYFLIPWIFDFKSYNQSSFQSLIQIIIIGSSLWTAFDFLFGRQTAVLSKNMRWVLICFEVWLAGAFAVGIARGLSIEDLIKTGIPPAFFILTALFTYKILCEIKDFENLIKSLFKIMILVVIWKSITVFLRFGLDPEVIRWNILSSVTELFSAYIVSRSFYRFTFRDIIGAVVNFGIILLSLTRTQVIIVGAMFVTPYLSRLSLLWNPKALLRITALLVILGVGATVASSSSIANDWIIRFTASQNNGTGFDPTAATRLAEIDYQISAVAESFDHAVFGLGLAAETQLTGDYAILVAETVGEENDELHDRGFGHCQYTSLIFTGGVAFGFWALLASLYLIVTAFRVTRQCIVGQSRDQVMFIGLWASLSIIGFSIYGLLAASFGDRGHSVFFGLSTGMMYWAEHNLRGRRQ